MTGTLALAGRSVKSQMPPCSGSTRQSPLGALIASTPSAGGAWVRGRIGGHRFDALVFPEHADETSYELNESRISKLWVQRISDRATVVNFDRGWDIRPTTPVAQQIVDLLAEGLADTIYES